MLKSSQSSDWMLHKGNLNVIEQFEGTRTRTWMQDLTTTWKGEVQVTQTTKNKMQINVVKVYTRLIIMGLLEFQNN